LKSFGNVELTIKIRHRGEINRARYMPQNPFIVATKSPSAEVFIFDISKHPSTPENRSSFCPDHVCYGHAREGYGLCWNPQSAGLLLSGSDDACICLWDVNSGLKQIETLRRWKGHSDVVEDIAWHSQSPHVFASVGDDRKLLLWDVRKPNVEDPTIKVSNAHAGDVNTIAFNPLHEFLLSTGSADTLVNLWDLRNTSRAVHVLKGHDQEVFQVLWAPFNSSVLATCGADRRVRIWDVSRIGLKDARDEVTTQKGEDPPELLFIHGGHTSTVSELSWSCKDSWMVASVSEDNMLQIWKLVRLVGFPSVLNESSGCLTSQCRMMVAHKIVVKEAPFCTHPFSLAISRPDCQFVVSRCEESDENVRTYVARQLC